MIDLVGEKDVMPEVPAHVMVQVTNRNPFVIRDRFNGIPVVFRPNETMTISPAEANHFFGYPGTKEEMAIHCAKRFGWNSAAHVQRDPRHEDDGSDAPMVYQANTWNIEIKTQEFVMVPKGSLKADDGLDVETMPVQEGHPAAPVPQDTGRARVGNRKGTPVRFGGRRPGRQRKPAAAPAADPSFTPLG